MTKIEKNGKDFYSVKDENKNYCYVDIYYDEEFKEWEVEPYCNGKACDGMYSSYASFEEAKKRAEDVISTL